MYKSPPNHHPLTFTRTVKINYVKEKFQKKIKRSFTPKIYRAYTITKAYSKTTMQNIMCIGN